MKKLFLFLLFPVLGVAQNTWSPNAYFDADVHLGGSFEKIIADAINSDNSLDSVVSVGGSAVIGGQIINRFGLGAGIKYSYLDTDAGSVFLLIQPKVFFGEGEEASFVYFNYGQSMNQNSVRNARLYGLGISDLFSVGNHHGFYYGVFLENQRLDFGEGYKSFLLMGLKVGLILNTRKNK